MRIVITGGSGLIGRALTRSLSADHHDVIVLSRDPARVTALPQGVRVEQWDGKTADGWGALSDGADAIVNLAGENLGGTGFFPPRWTPALKQKFLESRRDAANAVTAAVKAATRKPKTVVQLSAVGYYGPHGDELLDEGSSAGSDFLAHICVEWEAASAGLEEMGVRRVVLRTGLVMTPNQGILKRLTLPFKLFAGGPLGSGRQGMPWIHIADHVAGMRFLLEKPSATGVFNLTAPNPVSNAEFARVLGRVMGRPSFMPAPAFAFRLAFGEAATLVLDGQRVLPKRLLEAGFQFRFPELEPALRDLLARP